MISVRRFAFVGFAFTLAACDASSPADSRESAALTLVPSARFIERVFGATTTLSARDPAAQDGQANDLFGAFDFQQKPLPPLILPQRNCL